MVRLIAYEIFRMIQDNPKWKRRIKIFAVVGIFGVVVGVGSLIWAGISAVQFVASGVNMQLPLPQVNIALSENIKFDGQSCKNQIQTMVNLKTWSQNPPVENFKVIKEACLKNDEV